MIDHRYYLLEALQYAKIQTGFCAPNPAVGAVIVQNNTIISTGFHLGAGHAHAEADALKKLHHHAAGATLYVTLEPCCHFGRTPPCTDLIKKTGIAKVYFGFLDPNPVVSGKGALILNQSGIICQQIILSEINLFYEPYDYWTKNKKPIVAAKLAVSADYHVARAHITGVQCDLLTQQYRKKSDAILTTINTVLSDNPSLNVRFNHTVIAKPIYILDSTCRLPCDAKIWKTAKSITIFYSQKANQSSVEKLMQQGARCILINENVFGLNLDAILSQIGNDGFQTLWIEAGKTCFDSFLKQDLLHQAIIYVSTKVFIDHDYHAKIDLNAVKNKFNTVYQNQHEDDLVFEYLLTNKA